MRGERRGRAERAFPWERGLPSPPANGRAHGPRHALRARGGLKVRAPEQCSAAAQGATGIPARDFPPVGRDRRARRDFNPKSAMERGLNHQGTKKCGISRRGAEAQRGAATPPKTGDRGQGTGDSRELRAGQGPGRGGKMRVLPQRRGGAELHNLPGRSLPQRNAGRKASILRIPWCLRVLVVNQRQG